MNAKVYIVLVNWNGIQDTLECLESVLRLAYPAFQVVVCDNDSSDGSVERIVEWSRAVTDAVRARNPALAHLVQPNVEKPISVEVLTREELFTPNRPRTTAKVTVIRTGSNLGFAGANNIGMRFAAAAGDATYFWLLNNDTVVEPNALRALVTRAKEAENKGMVGSTLVFYDRPESLQAMGVFGYSPQRGLGIPIGAFRRLESVNSNDQVEAERRAAYVVGASILVPLRFYTDVGDMCEDYFLYFEELDWALRARKYGYRCLYAPASIVYHKVGATTARVASSRLSIGIKYSYANRLKFTARFYRRELPRVRMRILAEAGQALIQGRWREAKLAAALAVGKVKA